MPLAVGMRFGRYELLEKVGAGGMGEVYRARDLDLGRDVAVKFLPERFAADSDRLARFATEARAASSLNHPNIVTIHEVGRADHVPFIVMEYVEGQTLRKLMQGRPLPARRVLDFAVQLADGLAKAHAAGIVHRDLKPENVMVSVEGFVKILDFGLAKLRAPGRVGSSPSDADTVTDIEPSPHTDEGAIVGTVGYMSPEQARGLPADFRADQFALGAIVYEMATGRQPFKRDSAVQTLSAIIESEPEPLSTLNPAFPAPARWVVERCLAKDSGGRYASTADLAQDLRTVREHLSEVSSSTATTSAKDVPARGRWRHLLGGGTVAVLLLLALPATRDRILGPLQLLPLPAERRVVVLPFHSTGSSVADQQVCEGLLDYVVARLGQLERFQQGVWVVPTIEVRQSGVEGVDAARRALGATLVVTGSLHRVGERVILTLSLVNAVEQRQLRATTVDVEPGTASLLDQAVDAVVAMLDFELSAEARRAMRAGGTGVAEASSFYAQALSYTPYDQARNALQRHDQEQSLERAIELFTRALERDREYALAHAGLGEAYWRLSRLTKNDEQVGLAEEHCRRAIALDATLSQAWVTMGLIHIGTGRAEEAVQDLRRALDRRPRDANAHRELANAYERLGKGDEADATYREAIALDPDSWVNRNYYGNYLSTHGRAADAQTQLEAALALVPDNPRVWSNLGVAFYFQGKFAEAERAWQRSMQLRPTVGAASNIGTRQFFEGRYAEAARAFERATALDGRDYRVWRNLAAAYYWTPEERPKAAETYRRAAAEAERERALDPTNASVLSDLADCYAMLGQVEKALSLLGEAERLGRDNGPVARSIAETHERLGNRVRALEWVGLALGAGVPRAEVERAPGFASLCADPRYLALVGRP